MAFVINEPTLTSRQKDRQAEEYIQWLRKHDRMPKEDSAIYLDTLLEAQQLLIQLKETLIEENHLDSAKAKLTQRVQELLASIRL